MRRQFRISKVKVIFSLVLSVSFLIGCAPSPPASVETVDLTDPEPTPTRLNMDELPGSQALQSEVERDLSPEVSGEDMIVLVAGNNGFAWNFYQSVRVQDGNLFFSPFSISIALAMTYGGARGDTASQMADTLSYSLPQDRLHSAFNALELMLAGDDEDIPDDNAAQSFQLNIANSLWGQSGYPFLSEFIDLLGRNYGAGLQIVDFIKEAEKARVEINDWIAMETGGKIKDLIPEGAIDDLTRLVLTNAIYFKADWLHPFEKGETSEGLFTLLDGNQKEVQMMSHESPPSLPYLEGDGYQVIELPYIGDNISMVIVVPDRGKFEEVEGRLDADLTGELLDTLEPHLVTLRIPKFSFESSYGLKDKLTSLGMVDAFDEKLADFSGMDGTQNLYIGDVFHKAFVAVDEKGTEAAAATAVIIKAESAVESEVVLSIDRPFIFLIRDKSSGSLLFLGRVLDPEG